jgi:hypothetical protein
MRFRTLHQIKGCRAVRKFLTDLIYLTILDLDRSQKKGREL